MMFSLLAAAYTFTATATGVEKGAPIEFAFAARETEHDYETMFLIDGSVDAFCAGLEKAGLKRGRPSEYETCRLWPVGCELKFDPPLEHFIDISMPEGLSYAAPIYTGGVRFPNGSCEAATNAPMSVLSFYTLAQSPIVLNGIFEQGVVYNCFTARKTLEKGARHTFTISWDEKSMPQSVRLTAKPGKSAEILLALKTAAEKGEIDALVDFDDALSVREATALAEALATIDSRRVKLNGCGSIFYRAFLPLVKWRDRRERLLQPFELTLGDKEDTLVFIAEDWSADNLDPKLTPRVIPFDEAARHPQTTTCFLYATAETTIERLRASMAKLKGSAVKTWYVFQDNRPSLHNPSYAK